MKRQSILHISFPLLPSYHSRLLISIWLRKRLASLTIYFHSFKWSDLFASTLFQESPQIVSSLWDPSGASDSTPFTRLDSIFNLHSTIEQPGEIHQFIKGKAKSWRKYFSIHIKWTILLSLKSTENLSSRWSNKTSPVFARRATLFRHLIPFSLCPDKLKLAFAPESFPLFMGRPSYGP